MKHVIKQVLPNAYIGQDIQGACYLYDSRKKVMGYVTKKKLLVYRDYEHLQALMERLINNNIKFEVLWNMQE